MTHLTHLAPDAQSTAPGPRLSRLARPVPRDTILVVALTAASAVHQAVLRPEAGAGAHKAEVGSSLCSDEAGASELDILPVPWLPELHRHVIFGGGEVLNIWDGDSLDSSQCLCLPY